MRSFAVVMSFLLFFIVFLAEWTPKAHGFSPAFSNMKLRSTGLVGRSSSPVLGTSATDSKGISLPTPTYNTSVNTIQEIMSRGELLCGMAAVPLAGLGNYSVPGHETGLEVSLCQAYAAGLGVVPTYVLISSRNDRYTFLNNRSVDVIIDSGVATMTRELVNNCTFGPVYMHDGPGILALNSALGPGGATDISAINGTTICALFNGTNSGLPKFFAAHNLNATIVPVNGGADAAGVTAAAEAMASGQCKMFSVFQTCLVTARLFLESKGIASTILVNPAFPLANDPFAPVTLTGDINWAFYINWITEGLFIAEANNITQSTLLSATAESNATITGEGAILIGLDNTVDQRVLEMGQAISRAIARVGNFGEIFNASFFGLLERLPADIPYQNGGCHYYTPLRSSGSQQS